MSVSYSSFVTPVAALALILGANLGTAINPLFEATVRGNPASFRLPVGNLANRIVGCALVLPFLQPIANQLAALDPNPVRFAADFHTAFNVILAALFILPLNGVAVLMRRALPEHPAAADPATPLYLDETVIGEPIVALTCAAREVLHLGDLVEAMLRQSMNALLTDNRKLVAEISRMDNAVDRLHESIKLHVVTKVMQNSPDAAEAQRATEIISATINLKHIGDIIDKNLMELAAKKIKHGYAFSKEGAAELTAIHRRAIESLKLAFGILISGDPKIARQLFAEKVALRNAEFTAEENHIARLRERRPESIESSSLRLDVLGDLKRIHSHFCSFAYPILERTGEIGPSRFKDTQPASLADLSGSDELSRPFRRVPEVTGNCHPKAIIVPLEGPRKKGTIAEYTLREFALDMCERAFLLEDWQQFDKWMRILAQPRSSG